MAALGRDATLLVLEGGEMVAGRLGGAMAATLPRRFRMATASRRNFAAVDERGRLYTQGVSHFGMLGLPPGGPDVHPLTRVDLGQRVAQVAMGMHHTIVLLADGAVLTAGNGLHGRLGHGGADEHVALLSRVQALSDVRVVYVAAGEQASAVVTLAGRVLAFGSNDFGELGVGDTDSRSLPRPTRACGASPTVMLAMSRHTVAVQADGSAYAWGDNSHEQLGLGDREPRLWPTRLEAGPVASAACGTEHTLVLCTDGVVYMCGFRSGQRLARVQGAPPAVSVAAGHWRSAAVAADGRLFTWDRYRPEPEHWPQAGRVGIFQRTVLPARALAFAMLSHPRLGAACAWNALLIPDVVRHVLDATLPPAAGALDGLARVLGGYSC